MDGVCRTVNVYALVEDNDPFEFGGAAVHRAYMVVLLLGAHEDDADFGFINDIFGLLRRVGGIDRNLNVIGIGILERAILILEPA